jgi:hypothetical protein
MKTFTVLPEKFTRKGITYEKSNFTKEDVKITGRKFRTVVCKSDVSKVVFYLAAIPPQFELKSNQYIPSRGKSLASGMPACSTYYYFVNRDGKVIDVVTLKPYNGKQMDRYALYNKTEAEAYLKEINKSLQLYLVK